MRELPRNSQGKKLYPICGWEANQHKIYNAHDRAYVRYFEEPSAENETELARVDTAVEAFENCVINGVVFATWDDGQIIKDLIYGYDLRH